MNKKRKSAEDDEVETRKSSRQASNSSSTILPQICIFCGGDSKYKKKGQIRERPRDVVHSSELKTIATERHDAKLIALHQMNW